MEVRDAAVSLPRSEMAGRIAAIVSCLADSVRFPAGGRGFAVGRIPYEVRLAKKAADGSAIGLDAGVTETLAKTQEKH